MQQHAAQLQQDNSRFDGSVFDLLKKAHAEPTLRWNDELGIGYYPVKGSPYDQAYFDRFARQAEEHIGKQLMRNRAEFVGRFYHGTLVDVGIGSGAFVELRNGDGQPTLGYDVNQAGIAWLNHRGLWRDPYKSTNRAVSMWDVIEHMDDFRPLLAKVSRWLFLAVPIFKDKAHVLRSKHFRKDEHFWYFSERGLIRVMGDLGFDLVKQSNMEIEAGREDIGAFAFRRK